MLSSHRVCLQLFGKDNILQKHAALHFNYNESMDGSVVLILMKLDERFSCANYMFCDVNKVDFDVAL